MRRGRGFSLIELMVVVTIVGISAAVAIPSFSEIFLDRRVQDDAHQIAALLREARARAMSRGSAVMVSFTGGQTAGGTFRVYEAVTTMPGAAAGADRAPFGSCRSPMRWLPLDATNANVWLLEERSFTGPRDVAAKLTTEFRTGTTSDPSQAFLCFTPTGRVLVASNKPDFDASPLASNEQFVLQRTSLSLARRVLVTSAGTFRVRSTPTSGGL